jgi:Leucine-rich repeat (LRR) protein
MLEIDRIGEGICDLNYVVLIRNEEGLLAEDYNLLNLHGNDLNILSGLPRLPFLTELNLSSNKFQTCDLIELSYLPSLKHLDLSANFISSISDLPFLSGLETLSVAFNMLHNVEGIDENAPNLQILDIRGNSIHEPIDLFSLSLMRKLRELNLGGRRPNPICSEVQNMLQIFQDCQSLEIIDGKNRQQWDDVVAASMITEEIKTPNFDKILHRFRTYR